MPIKQHRSAPIYVKTIDTDAPDGTFEAFVSVFNNVDSAKEIVMPGAFKNSLAKKLPKVAWGHDWTEIIGSVKEAAELTAGDPRLPPELSHLGGLLVRAELDLDVQRAKEAYSLLRKGHVTEFSIGYKVLRAHRVTEEGEQVDDTLGWGMFGAGKSTRYLDELELYECSPVLAGANSETMLVGIKDGMPLGDQIDTLMAAHQQIHAEAKELLDRRIKEGRTFSAANFAKLEGYADSLDEVVSGIRTLLDSAKRESDSAKADEKDIQTPVSFDPAVALKEVAQVEIQRVLMTRRQFELVGSN